MSIRRKFGSTSAEMTARNEDDEIRGEEEMKLVIEKEKEPSKMGLFSFIGLSIVLFQVICEVSKQISNYSIQYYNNGKYPVASTAMVVSTEFLKLIFTIFRIDSSLPHFNFMTLKKSLKYMIPSILYAFNNNIYLYGLTLVPPPIWLILCSMRTLVTALIYRVFLKRTISTLQYLGIGGIVSSLVIAKVPDLMFHSINSIPLFAIGLAFLASCISAFAAIFTELLFKSSKSNDNSGHVDSFYIKQFWLYLYGLVISFLIHLATNPSYTIFSYSSDIINMDRSVLIFYIAALSCGSIGGITVASILKYLDNIVKEYTGSFGNVITAIISSCLFPDKFQFTIFVIISLAFLIMGILLYETQKPKNIHK
ncbi:uncharacterized protein [Lepeophtheirus salmonis]|uniref:uncharacterized protein n=1 Tax=Lepeophtheirus salmonis TaxID=72036 RepID=UPI001AE8F7E1|nr:CMP-sialic acid transporter 1-like [Lepeophtheirus salmonis]